MAESEARTFTRKGQATRERIVDAAATLMFTRGVAQTSIEDVQLAAHVSASQLYHYFGDRRALIRAVIAHQTRVSLSSQQPYLSNLDSLEALRAWRDLLVRTQDYYQCKGGCPIGALAGELSESCDVCRQDLAESFSAWEGSIRVGLQAMADRGDLGHSADAETLALALLVAVQGGLLLTQVRRDSTPLRVALDTMLDYIASLDPRQHVS